MELSKTYISRFHRGSSTESGQIQAVARAAIYAVIAITAITILADLYPPAKEWLKNTFTHHWIGKGVIGMAIFAVLAIIEGMRGERTIAKVEQSVRTLIRISLLGTIVLLAFFFYEFLK